MYENNKYKGNILPHISQDKEKMIIYMVRIFTFLYSYIAKPKYKVKKNPYRLYIKRNVFM